MITTVTAKSAVVSRSQRCGTMNKCGFIEWLAGHTLLTISLLIAAHASGSPPEGDARAAELAKWRVLIPAVESTLTRQGNPCSGERMRAGPADAADFAGNSIALVDVCPLGAYTELMVAMRLEGSQAVLASFRKANHKVDLEFAQGSSVMHGKDVKLVPKKRAIYDISWDNDGMDGTGNVQWGKCVVDAYVWNSKSKTFDWDAKLTKQATRSHCEDLKQQGH